MVQYPYRVETFHTTQAGKVAYIDEGAGERTILFIHGLSNYAMGWAKNFHTLRNKYRCIAVDLPGNGLSERGDHHYSIHFFASVIEELITGLGLMQLCICGHSMGAQIAVTLLLNRPDIGERTILFAPAGFETFTPIEVSMYEATLQVFDLFASEEQSLAKSIRTSFFRHQQDAEGMIDDLIKIMHQHPMKDYRRMAEACIKGMLHEPIFNSLHLLTHPTLVIFGDRDALIPNRILHPVTTRQVGEAGVKQLQNGKLHMVPQSGHFVQWEKAREVNELIEEFLD